MTMPIHFYQLASIGLTSLQGLQNVLLLFALIERDRIRGVKHFTQNKSRDVDDGPICLLVFVLNSLPIKVTYTAVRVGGKLQRTTVSEQCVPESLSFT